MAKGRFMGFVSKVANLAGAVIPGAGVAGKLAENASRLMKDKDAQATLKKERQKQIDKETKIAGAMLGGQSSGMAKFQLILSDAWEFVKNNWYIVLPAVLALLWVLIFRKKKVGRRPARRATGKKYIPVRRKWTAQPKGSAWARKMLLARRKKARARKK